MTENTYKKRGGTTDSGKLYEEYFPAYVILQLLQNKGVEDFRISTNDEEFGDFDDLVLEVEHTNQLREKYAVQMKHRNRDVKIENLKSGKDFNIMKYYKSFQENIQKLSEYKLILFTNGRFTVDSNTTLELDGNVKVKITECELFPIINTSERGKPFQFQLEPDNSEEIKQKYKYFFERFFLYTDQKKAHELKQVNIPHALGKLTSQTSVQGKFLKFISEWSQIDGIKNKLTKDVMVKVMTLHIVEEFIHPHVFCGVNKEKKIFQNAISHFNITALGSESLENVVKIWGDAKSILQDGGIQQAKKIIRQFQICTKNVLNIDDLTDEEATKLLWVMDKCPLIIKDHPAAYEAFRLCGENSKFVFITDELNGEKLEKLTVFKTLSDLEPHGSTYNNVLKNLSFTLFGEETNLEKLIKNDDAFDNLITTTEITKIVDNVDLIRLKEEKLCFPYVERHLYRNIIDSKYLQKVDENTMILISGLDDEKNLRKRLQNFEVLSITEELHKYADGTTNSNDNEKFETNQDRSSKYRLFFNKTETSLEEFTELCNKNKKYKKFHHFKYHDQHLEWIESIGDVSDLQKFCIKNEDSVEEEKFCAEKIRNNLNIILGDPGMGKSVFVKSLKNRLLSRCFTVMIQPIDVPELFRTMTDPENIGEFFTFILKSKFSNTDNFGRQILELLLKKGKAVFLWDALDELSETNRIFVEKLIATLSKKSLAQFVTSRGFLQKHLEDHFKIFSQELMPFNDQQQTDYIQKRLQDICSDNEEMKSITTAIKENISNTSFREILGIPLQTYMLTELFRQDLEKYRKFLTKSFVITDLYSHFIQEKFNLYFKTKKGFPENYNEVKSLKRQMENQKKSYQQVALRLLFGRTFLSKASTELDGFLKEIENEGDEFGFITAVNNEMEPEFLHLSYAEYFAATYVAENCRSISDLENVLFHRKYANVRYFFDFLLAKGCPVHVAVLSKNFNYFQNCEDENEFKRKDLLGRNPLHLAASWAERYPLLETTDINDESTFGATILIDDNIPFETKEENSDYHNMLVTLLMNCDPRETDQLFNFTPTMYAEKCECLFAAALIENRQGNQNYLEAKDQNFFYSLLYYGIRYGFHEIVDLFGDIEFACTESGSTLMLMAVENNQLQYLSKLLEHEVFKQNINRENKLGEKALHIAAKKGFMEIVEYLIQEHASVNAVDNEGWTPLYLAVVNGHLETVKYLIQEQANVNAATYHGETPLHQAVLNGHLETVKYLIQEHANVNAVSNHFLYKGWTPLHHAASNGHLEIVKCLIQEHANVNTANQNGWTPLHQAALKGHIETVKYLIQEHANVNAANQNGWTPLHQAALKGHLETVKYLIQEHANVNAANKDGWTPLYQAASEGHIETVKYLIQEHANVNAVSNHFLYKGWTPLHHAASSGHLEIVKCLIQEHANVNAANKDGSTPLYQAALEGHIETVKYLIQKHANVNAVSNHFLYKGWTPLHHAAFNGHLETVKCLIQEHANVNAANKNGWTPLYQAALKGHIETVKYLIQEHANVNAVSNHFLYKGWTPLHHAASNGHLKTVKCLIQEHANVNAVDKNGWTPLYQAALKGNIETVKYLIQEHANVNAASNNGWTSVHTAAEHGHIETMKYLIQEHANVNAADNDGWTPLHAAAECGHIETVKYLIQEHANVNAANKNGLTPLYQAALKGHIETLKYLIQEHANVNTANNDGWTPLHAAAEYGHMETVKYLIEEHANVNAAANDGWIPLHLAAHYGHLDTVKYLIEKGANIKAVTSDGTTVLLSSCYGGLLVTVRYLIEQNLNVNAADDDGSTPLMAASEQGHLDIVELLIKAGATVNVYNKNFETPLTKACELGNEAIVQFLIQSGASVNSDVEDAETSSKKPLYIACKNGHKKIVEILLEAGADYETPTNNGQTYVEFAIENHHEEIAELLSNRQAGRST